VTFATARVLRRLALVLLLGLIALWLFA